MGGATHQVETRLQKGDPARAQQTTLQPSSSSPIWERLATFVREQVQRLIQALLGRPKSARRAAVDAPQGMRNGSSKPRRLSWSLGTITVRRPRGQSLGERFVSRVLPLFQRRTREVGALLPQLYLHGLALGDFELALRVLLREGASLSATSLARRTGSWRMRPGHSGGAMTGRWWTCGPMAWMAKRGWRTARPPCWC